MIVGGLRASLAHEHVWCRGHVGAKLVARCAYRALPVLVDQEHRPSLSPLRTLVAHSVSSGATFFRSAGFVVLRSKPPCLITLTARADASLRSTAALLTSPIKPSTSPPGPKVGTGSRLRRPSPCGNERFMRPPGGAFRRSVQMRGRRHPRSPSRPSALANASPPRPRTSDQAQCHSRPAR